MSGGTFDYQEYRMHGIADDITHMLQAICDNDDPKHCTFLCEHDILQGVSERTRHAMEVTAAILMHIYEIVHSLDYWLAGDSGEEEFLEDYEKHMAEIASLKF